MISPLLGRCANRRCNHPTSLFLLKDSFVFIAVIASSMFARVFFFIRLCVLYYNLPVAFQLVGTVGHASRLSLPLILDVDTATCFSFLLIYVTKCDELRVAGCGVSLEMPERRKIT